MRERTRVRVCVRVGGAPRFRATRASHPTVPVRVLPPAARGVRVSTSSFSTKDGAQPTLGALGLISKLDLFVITQRLVEIRIYSRARFKRYGPKTIAINQNLRHR